MDKYMFWAGFFCNFLIFLVYSRNRRAAGRSGTGEVGFSALPGGYRNTNGNFYSSSHSATLSLRMPL